MDIDTKINIEQLEEILQDTLFFNILLNIKKDFEKIEDKNAIAMILKTIAPIITHEIAIWIEQMGLEDKSDFFLPGVKKKVKANRNKELKGRIISSSNLEPTIEQMGLSFEVESYDINIVVSNNNKLLDFNFEEYFEKLEVQLQYYEGLFFFCRNVVDKIFSKLGVNYEDFMQSILYEMESGITLIKSKLGGTRYSYSVHKLFINSSLKSNEDKIFILAKYRIVYILSVLDDVIPHMGKITLTKTSTFINFNNSFRKLKAIYIEIIGQELRTMDSQLSNLITNKLNEEIDNTKFYSLNRKLRNNIHYQKVDKLIEEEIEIVDKYQIIYFKVILSVFDAELYVKIDRQERLMTEFLYDAQENGLTKKELFDRYEELYLGYWYKNHSRFDL